MSTTMSRRANRRSWDGLVTIAVFMASMICLYVARAILIPIAFAILLSFLLSPLVTGLEKRYIGRVWAVVVVVLVAGVFVAGFGWLVWQQTVSLARDLPSYQSNIRNRIADLRALTQGAPFARAAKSLKEAADNDESPQAAEDADESASRRAMPVRIVTAEDEQLTDLQSIATMIAPLLGPLPSVALVVVLVSFMLIRREDLRNRMLGLIGQGHITLASKAIDEAGQRISRYLLMQLLINGCFGLGISIGLYLIGVPYAIFWGSLAGVLRYVPYVGPWLGALLAIAMSLMIFESWLQPLLVIGLFGILELATNLVLEPRLYGRSIGMAEVPFIIAVAFWTWIWGPVGLVLATPLTVCLAVLGKNVPQLKFLDALLGDGQGLAPEVTFYQRLISQDQDEATDIAEEYLESTSIDQVCDELLIPALTNARQALRDDLLTKEEFDFVVASTREILEQLTFAQSRDVTRFPDTDESSHSRLQIVACPVHDEADEVGLLIFRQLLDPRVCDLDLSSSHRLAAELVEFVDQARPAVVCLAAIPPGGLAKARLYCKRLRARFDDLKIVVGLWGLTADVERSRTQLLEAGADFVGTTLAETRGQLVQLVALVSAADRTEADAKPVAAGDSA
jgi:predicted PurR-regulated permease PerM